MTCLGSFWDSANADIQSRSVHCSQYNFVPFILRTKNLDQVCSHVSPESNGTYLTQNTTRPDTGCNCQHLRACGRGHASFVCKAKHLQITRHRNAPTSCNYAHCNEFFGRPFLGEQSRFQFLEIIQEDRIIKV